MDSLQEKLSGYLVKRLRYWLDIEGWQGVEVHQKYGWPSNRQAEAKKGLRPVSWPIMKTLVSTKFVTITELEEHLPMTDQERAFVQEEFAPYSDPELHTILKRFQKAGLSLSDLGRSYIEDNPEDFLEE